MANTLFDVSLITGLVQLCVAFMLLYAAYITRMNPHKYGMEFAPKFIMAISLFFMNDGVRKILFAYDPISSGVIGSLILTLGLTIWVAWRSFKVTKIFTRTLQ